MAVLGAGPRHLLTAVAGLVHHLGRARNVPELARRIRYVRRPLRFVVKEVDPRPSRGRYELSGSALTAVIRHHTDDIGAINEFFIDRLYDFPEPIRRHLEARGPEPAIVDLGAHVGFFGLFVLGELGSARITAVEPDAGNADVLRECIAANGRTGTWRVIEAAAAPRDGRVRFAAGEGMSSRIVDGEEDGRVVTVDAVDVFPLLEEGDLCKMDIEGGEWALLADPRLQASSVGPLVVEYHAHLCPGPDPETAAHELLARAGYEIQPIFFDRERGIGMAWAWPAAPAAP